jgi:type III restriction enzyme
MWCTRRGTDLLFPVGGTVGGDFYGVEIGNMKNIAFWTRNIERRGFRINGFINHYPDFIIQMVGGKTLILETKGDHLDAEQKIRLGNLWAIRAGNNYRYFVVYARRVVAGTYNMDDFLNIIREI